MTTMKRRIWDFLNEETRTDTVIIKGLQVLSNALFIVLCMKWLFA